MVVLEQLFELRFVGLVTVPNGAWQRGFLFSSSQYFFHGNHGGVALLVKLAVFVVHIRHTAAHASCKVAAGFTQHSHRTAGHVFATVVACAFDHSGRARQTHSETLTSHAGEERFTACRTNHHGVTHDDVVHRIATEVDARAHHHAAA